MDKRNIDAYKQQLAALGVNITSKSFKEAELKAQQAAKAKAQQDFKHESGNLRAKNFVTAGLNAGTVAGITLVVVIFTVIMFGLFIVESLAVIHALQTLLPTYEAVLLGVVLVGSLYVVLFVQQLLITNRLDSYRWSLRLWWKDFKYTLGFSDARWEPRYKEYDPYKDSVKVLRALVIAVIALSTLGRLGTILQEVRDMPAHEGLQVLIYETSLTEWFSVILVGFATFAIISASHFAFTFLYRNFVRITGGGIDLNQSPKSLEQLELEYLEDQYNTMLMHQQAKAQITANS